MTDGIISPNGVLSVVVITRNRPELLASCLDHLLAQDYRPLDVIVVDASDDARTQEVVSGYPEVRNVRFHRAHQIPASRNEGIRHARGDIIAFLDDDSMVQPGWASQLVADYTSPGVGGVGGLVLGPGERGRTGGAVGTVTRTGSVLGDFDVITDGPVEVGHLRGCNMSFRREALHAVGGFDPLLDMSNYRDETDVCVGVVRAGFKLIYDPRVAVVHMYAAKDGFQRDDWKDPWHRYSIAKNTAYFRLKHFASPRTAAEIYLGGPLLVAREGLKRSGIAGLWLLAVEVAGRWAGGGTWVRSRGRRA